MHGASAGPYASTLAVIVTGLWLGPACSSSLDPNLDNRSCTAEGECVHGYVCSEDHLCVRADHAERPVRAAADGGGGRTPSSAGASGSEVGPPMTSAPIAGATSALGAVASMSGSGSASAGAGGSSVAAAMAGMGGAASAPAMSGSPAAGGSGASQAGSPAPAGAPAPAAAGRGGMSAQGLCTPGLVSCEGACVDVQHNSQHCGSCKKRCKNDQVCVIGQCVKEKEAPVAMNDVAGLGRLLALFGLELDDLANVVGVGVDDLATTPITLTDLAALGINESALALLGLSLDTLALVGIQISLK
jgi:Stigma-specific protein, Stig1